MGYKYNSGSNSGFQLALSLFGLIAFLFLLHTCSIEKDKTCESKCDKSIYKGHESTFTQYEGFKCYCVNHKDEMIRIK